MTASVEELNEISRPLGWVFNPEAPKEDIDKVVQIFGDWLESMIAADRQSRILAVFHKKRRARRGRRNR